MQKERCMGGPYYTKYFPHNSFIIMKKKTFRFRLLSLLIILPSSRFKELVGAC